MRAGWTMIELIFMLIVVGILAAIAVSKLTATRDDAKLSADVSNMSICIRSVAAHYTATGIMDINIASCNKVNCYTVDINGSIMQVDINISAADYCDDIENVGGHLIHNYQFAGQSIER
ncbi:hypothetical protein TSL1_14590 [Sulfurovum sp. TSL1]|nr:hypothetical protein TSL1_14590 [Sulfurovum sp. TSL1]